MLDWSLSDDEPDNEPVTAPAESKVEAATVVVVQL